MICPECRAEYVGGVKICVDCGVPLVEHLPGEEPELTPLDDDVAPVVDHDGNYEEVYVGLNRAEVAIIKSMFDDAGFDYLCENEQQITALPMRILVRRDQVDEALVVLRSLDEPET